MTNFLCRKGKSAEENLNQLMRQKLKLIMKTLQTEKDQFYEQYNLHMKRYQEELIHKDQKIEELTQQLKRMQGHLTVKQKQTEKYKGIINTLKGQFQKLAEVVDQTNLGKTTDYEPLTVFNDNVSTKQSIIYISDLQTQSLKSLKFDINGYFQKIKQKCSIQKEEDDRTTALYTIEDNQSRGKQKYKKIQTENYFKECVNNYKYIDRKLNKWASAKAIPIKNEFLEGLRYQRSKQNRR